MKDWPARSEEVFRAQREAAAGNLDAMHGAHNAKGVLRSGNTVISAIRIAEEAGAAGLDQLHAECAKIVEQRGRRWKVAMAAIETELNTFTSGWQEWLAPSFRLAGVEQRPRRAGADDQLSAAADRLAKRHAEFRDGWTAPPGKPWRERHPVIWSGSTFVIGAAVGAAIGQGAPVAWSALFPPAATSAPASGAKLKPNPRPSERAAGHRPSSRPIGSTALPYFSVA